MWTESCVSRLACVSCYKKQTSVLLLRTRSTFISINLHPEQRQSFAVITMQFGLFLVVIILNSMDYTGSSVAKGRRQRRISTEITPVCPKGCELCSEYNGCLKCLSKLFILLERNDIKQTGICLPSCPIGYFGVRTPEMNKCTKCKIENCEACFSRNFCTKCKEGLYLHRGKCYDSCPEGFAATNDTMECSHAAQCDLGEWSQWGPCTKRGKTCGFKRGSETRTRELLQAPSIEDVKCPPNSESRTCTVQRKPCSSPGKKRNKKDRNRKGKKDKKNKGGDNSQNNKEPREKKLGNKKKKEPHGIATTTTTSSSVQ